MRMPPPVVAWSTGGDYLQTSERRRCHFEGGRRRGSACGRRRHRRTGARQRYGGRTLNDRSFDTEVQPIHSADAGKQTPASRGYRVRIEYAEPEFHRRNPHCPEAYTALFDCTEAGSRREAIDMALMEFDHYARVSRVRWHRIVRAITVE